MQHAPNTGKPASRAAATSPTGSTVVFGSVAILGFTVGQVAYYVLTQRRHGRTPGKRLAGIRVVDRNGNVPTTGALVKRTIPLIVEYFYVIAWIGMMASPPASASATAGRTRT